MHSLALCATVLYIQKIRATSWVLRLSATIKQDGLRRFLGTLVTFPTQAGLEALFYFGGGFKLVSLTIRFWLISHRPRSLFVLDTKSCRKTKVPGKLGVPILALKSLTE